MKVKQTRHIEVGPFYGQVTNEQIVKLYATRQPVSGCRQNAQLRTTCVLLEALAKERGIELPPSEGLTEWS